MGYILIGIWQGLVSPMGVEGDLLSTLSFNMGEWETRQFPNGDYDLQ